MGRVSGAFKAVGRLLAFFVISAVCGALVAGIFMPVAAATWGATNGTVQFFDGLPTELTVTPPARVTQIVAADGSGIATLYSENRTPVNLDQMSPNIKNAIIAIEDYRFYDHGGVDTTGILRAVMANVRGDRQGASTLTQQYVANVLKENSLAQGEDPTVLLNGQKSLGDKLREMKLAIALEKKYSKDDILAGYLNLVFFNTHAYGIQAASQYFFSVDAKDLTLPQAALLAGLVNGPSVYDPTQYPESSVARRNLVLDAMLQHGYISKKDHDAAVATPLQLKINPPHQGCAYATQAQYFCDYVLHQILNDPAYGDTPDARYQNITRNGLTITTTLDPRLQGPAQAQVDATAGANPDKWGTSLVTVQPGTGKVLAMAQNTRMLPGQGLDFVTSYNFNVDKTDANGNDLGGAGGFQPGSSVKPITLTAWLSEGKQTDAIVNAAQRRYPLNHPWRDTCAKVTGAYDDTTVALGTAPDLQNDEPNWYRPMTVREGIYQSINTATFASAAALSDFCDIQRAADALGMRDGAGKNQKLDLSTLGNLLGGMNVSPMTQASAYATFAANGTYCVPWSIATVKDWQGKQLGGQTQQCQPGAIKPDVAKAVTNVLQDVLTKGSGYNIKDDAGKTITLGVPDAAKTGTNQYNSQTWLVGYTKGLATASFFGEALGNPEDHLGRNVMVNGRFWPNIDGAYIAGPQWAYYMQKVLGLYDHGNFDPPPPSLITPGKK
ncbi:carboxypeptidase [Sinomonas cellulolyticus]|uniref:Transglycosylase domain-containing protein n=1 Tax=Sinomonas cellulolyticus TaxID=2801916 RepID=A0ABS1K296_9MICC|nr:MULTISPECIES: transglycosylase domain-containing protein [Sinomonas]MBL0705042.1 transglycosylase domain-containing protein [Sinomonas cellulolyticus]GHG53902.1 carboxypeptidase [Sinomonas sp. KCTC 49339]